MPKTYTTVPAVAAGDAILASSYNTYQKDNVNNLIVPPACRVTLGSNISPYTTGASIAWTSAPFDTDGMWSSGTATRITIQTTGLYVVTFSGQTSQASGSALTIGAPQIAIDGTNVSQAYFRSLAAGGTMFSISGIFSLTAAQYLTFNVEHEGGTTYTVAGGSGVARGVTRAEAVWIGRTS